MYNVITSNRFLKDLKRLKRRNIKDFRLLEGLIETLSSKGAKSLDRKYKAHKLSGNYKGYWECHIKPDLLLVWEQKESQMTIELVRIGSHSDIF